MDRNSFVFQCNIILVIIPYKKSNNLTFPFDNADIVIGEYDAVLLVVPCGVTAPHWSPGAVGVPPAGWGH